MKHITKHSEPAAFTTWKVNNTSGEIGYTSKRGRITIDLLNFNSALLKTMRKKLIDYF